MHCKNIDTSYEFLIPSSRLRPVITLSLKVKSPPLYEYCLSLTIVFPFVQ